MEVSLSKIKDGLKGFSIRNFFRKFSISTYRFWHTLIIVFAVVNIASLALNFFLYLKISSEEIFVPAGISPAGAQTINRKQVQDTLDIIELRSVTFDNLQLAPPETIDPAYGPKYGRTGPTSGDIEEEIIKTTPVAEATSTDESVDIFEEEEAIDEVEVTGEASSTEDTQ